MSGLIDNSQVFLSTLRPERRERRLAIAVVLVSAAPFVAVAPFAQVQLPRMPAFIPIYQSAILINDLITAALLIGQFNILRSRALLALTAGYLFTAFTAIAHMLIFPGLFAMGGLLGAGQQSTAWLYMFWHGGFPLAVMAYARPGRDRRPPSQQRNRPVIPIVSCVTTALLAASGLTLLATTGHDALPSIMQGQYHTSAMPGVATAIWMLNFLALAILWRQRPHSVLDMWVMVVMCAWLIDIALAAVFDRSRFDLGFYAGRIYGLLASVFVLFALLFENGRLYARVVRALDGERSERQRVQEKTAELNELNASLEHRIAARTAELEASNRHLRYEVVERERAEQALERSREELHEIAAIGSTAREQEKQRIARELHDELAQALTALRMDLGWLEQRVPSGDDVLATRIAGMQESLTNIARHARASRAEIKLIRGDGQVQLRVHDNGQGFDLTNPRKPNSFGLVGLRERAHLVDGQIRIDTSLGQGTTIEVSIPVHPPPQAS